MKRAWLGAMFLACASWGGVPDAELPGAPIAITYRTPEEARARADALRRTESQPPAVAAQGPTWVGSKAYLRADAGAVDQLLAKLFGTERGLPEAHPDLGEGRSGRLHCHWLTDGQRVLLRVARAAVLRSDDEAPAAFGRGRPGELALR